MVVFVFEEDMFMFLIQVKGLWGGREREGGEEGLYMIL